MKTRFRSRMWCGFVLFAAILTVLSIQVDAVTTTDFTMFYKMNSPVMSNETNWGSSAPSYNMTYDTSITIPQAGLVNNSALKNAAGAKAWHIPTAGLIRNSTIPFSMSFWYKRNGIPAADEQPVWGIGTGVPMWYLQGTTGHTKADLWNGGGYTPECTTINVNDNAWHWILIQTNGTSNQLEYFVDNVEIGTGTKGTTYTGSEILPQGSDNSYWDIITVSNTYLTPDIRATMYNAGAGNEFTSASITQVNFTSDGGCTGSYTCPQTFTKSPNFILTTTSSLRCNSSAVLTSNSAVQSAVNCTTSDSTYYNCLHSGIAMGDTLYYFTCNGTAGWSSASTFGLWQGATINGSTTINTTLLPNVNVWLHRQVEQAFPGTFNRTGIQTVVSNANGLWNFSVNVSSNYTVEAILNTTVNGVMKSYINVV